MNFKEFLNEGKSKAADAVKDLVSKMDPSDRRHVQVLAGKLENWTETDNPGMIADIVKYLAAMDTDPREQVLSVIEKADKSMYKAIMFKLSKKMNEGADRYFEVSDCNMSKFDDMMGDDSDMIGWEGDVAVVPSDIVKNFLSVCKKIGAKVKEVK